MTRDDQFIEQLESYLDEYEGLTPMPGIVRDAVRAALPTTRQAGPMQGLRRYFTMSIPKPAQYAIAAAAVILVVVAGAFALNGQNIGGPPPDGGTPTPAPSDLAAASATPSPCDGEIASVPTTGTVAIAWCPPSDGQTVVTFTMQAPVDWIDGVFGGTQALYLRPSGGGALAFAVGGADSVEAWVDSITGTEAYSVSEPQPVSFGGADGYVMDVSLAPGADADQAPHLFEDADLPWVVSDQDPARVWVIDHNGQPLMIVTTPATPAEFDAWTSAVGEALQTIEWGP